MKSVSLRLLALVPIPVVVLLVLWAGRRPVPPPPVLPHGADHGAGGGATGTVKLPTTLGQWSVQGKVERYDKKTLFDRIDGAAPAYIRAGFQYSLGAEWRRPGMKESIVADVYAMGSAARALGMYATERDPSYSFIKVGEAGYVASGSLNFWQGPFYVKLAGFEEGEQMDRALRELAETLAKALPKTTAKGRTELAPLAWLPAEGRVANSEGFSHPALADVEGLAGVYYASYRTEGVEDPFRLFVTRARDAAAAEQRLRQVKGYFEKDGAKVEQSTDGPLSVLTIQGEATSALVLRRGALLGGAVDLTDPKLVPVARARMAPALQAAEQPAAPKDETK